LSVLNKGSSSSWSGGTNTSMSVGTNAPFRPHRCASCSCCFLQMAD
jgi:hypothetical protein